jgi:Kef-type K+ transport system membrane component KefB
VLTLVAASIDDAAAWCFLAVITALAQSKGIMAGIYSIIGGVIFTAIMLYAVRPLLRLLGQRAEKDGFTQGTLAIVLVLVLLSAWFTDYVGIFSVFGGFVAGLAMPQSPAFRRGLLDRLADFNLIFLLPIFFTYSGLNTQLSGLNNLGMLVPFLLVLGAAIVGKYAGCGLLMKWLGYSWRESSAVGSLMNARGLMQLIMINVALSYSIIPPTMFSLLVLVAIITTAMAMPLYRFSLPVRFEEQIRQSLMSPPEQESSEADQPTVEVAASK